MARIRLTQKTLVRLPRVSNPRGQSFTDTVLRGFGCTKYPSGAVVFYVQYGGRQRRRRLSIGRYGPLTPEQARRKAERLLYEINEGRDPLAEQRAQRSIPTFAQYIKRYMADVQRRKKAARHDRLYLQHTAVGYGDKASGWGNKRLDTITRADVLRMRTCLIESIQADRDDEQAGHTSANRWLASVRSCLQAAVAEGLVAHNSAAGIKPFRERPPRARVLSRDELSRVLKAIDAEPDPHVRAAFYLLIETGVRKSEVLQAKWDDIDFQVGTWRIPSPKSGHPETVPLPASAASMLRALPRIGPHLVPGRDLDKPREGLRKPWDRIRKAAGVPDVHVHDLRRTYGLAVTRRAGLYTASKLLRHSDVRITERVYAPLGLDELRRATEQQSAKVVELRREKGGEA